MGLRRLRSNPSDPWLTYTLSISAYFGDLKDGTHKGDENDPRVSIIEVIPEEIRYWIATQGTVQRGINVAVSAVTGKIAAFGELRMITSEDVRLRDCVLVGRAHEIGADSIDAWIAFQVRSPSGRSVRVVLANLQMRLSFDKLDVMPKCHFGVRQRSSHGMKSSRGTDDCAVHSVHIISLFKVTTNDSDSAKADALREMHLIITNKVTEKRPVS